MKITQTIHLTQIGLIRWVSFTYTDVGSRPHGVPANVRLSWDMEAIPKQSDCVPGGYSVWRCPPPKIPKAVSLAKPIAQVTL